MYLNAFLQTLSEFFNTQVTTFELFLFGLLISTYLYLNKQWSSKRFSQQIRNIVEVHDIMNNIINTTNAERFVILKSQNGGGVPKVGSRIYSTVIYEVSGTKLPSVKDNFKKMQLDGPYMRILSKTMDKKDLILETGSLENGLLKELHQADEIMFSYMFIIKQEKTHAYYGLIELHKLNFEITNKDLISYKYAVNKLRKLF